MDKIGIIVLDIIITENSSIDPDGFSTIEFENIGSDDATIFDNVPLLTSSFSRKFEHRPGEIFSNSIKIKFSENSPDKKVLVTKTYFNEISDNEIIAKILANENISVIDQTNLNIIYIGYAVKGTKHTFETKFKIKRITSFNKIVKIEWAAGNQLYNKSFDNREIFKYSF